MFKKPIILSKIMQDIDKDYLPVVKVIDVEYENHIYHIKIEKVLNEPRYIWQVWYDRFNTEKNRDIMYLIAYSTKKYFFDLDLMEKDAFKCIQKIAKEFK